MATGQINQEAETTDYAVHVQKHLSWFGDHEECYRIYGVGYRVRYAM